MYNFITLHRGLDLKLKGAVGSDTSCVNIKPETVAITPDDFPGFTPKVAAKPGERILAGAPVLTDKLHPEIAIVSPVSGTVEEVIRGDRRKILRVVVKADYTNPDDRQTVDETVDIKQKMMRGGVWSQMRQLPYDIVPDPDTRPRDIFVTAFDSAPLATSLTDRVAGKAQAIQSAINALKTLTDGNVYIGVRNIASTASLWGSDVQTDSRVIITEFTGKHPAGLASVQASAQAPVNKGDTVWLLDVVTLARIGEVLDNGIADWTTTVALTGSDVKNPCLISTITGADITPIIKGQLSDSDHHKRIISGNVLTGYKVNDENYLRFPYLQATVIPEGDDVDEFMGWASLSTKKMSQNRSFLSKLFGRKEFTPDARINGGRRAMIMSGEYDKVFPMDILPEFLLKAIIARDIDKMEALGIYEVTPADFALCEYIDPSKLELQKTVREGLDYLRKELS